LQDNGYQYILGGRIKNESESIKKSILALGVNADQSKELDHPYGRLVVSYSEKRSAKDQFNRKKGLKRLEQKVKTNKLTKEAINNRGYNKYLILEGETKVSIDYQKFKNDQIWDGLKGFVSNTKLTREQIIGSYGNLWQVERAFRRPQIDLRFTPIFHRKEPRIKAHLIICFASSAIYKEPEAVIKLNQIDLSIQKAISELNDVQELTYLLPKSKQLKHQLLSPNAIQQQLLNMKI
jgi:hypothetical protein